MKPNRTTFRSLWPLSWRFADPLSISCVRAFLEEEDAATAVEYAVMIALIIGVCIGSVQYLTASTKQSFETSGSSIAGAMGS